GHGVWNGEGAAWTHPVGGREGTLHIARRRRTEERRPGRPFPFARVSILDPDLGHLAAGERQLGGTAVDDLGAPFVLRADEIFVAVDEGDVGRRVRLTDAGDVDR